MDVDVTKEATARTTPPSWRRSSIRYKLRYVPPSTSRNTKCTLAFLVSSASTKASNTSMAMHDFLATRQAIVAEIQAEQVPVSASGESIARFEQKIQPPSPVSGARAQVRESGM
jgi:hypothetical protein